MMNNVPNTQTNRYLSPHMYKCTFFQNVNVRIRIFHNRFANIVWKCSRRAQKQEQEENQKTEPPHAYRLETTVGII